jgi:hypothetical protein
MEAVRSRCSPYPSLVDALRLLPNIRLVCERHRLGEAKHDASRSPDRTASINGVSVTLAELEELFLHNKRGIPCVSQEGAALLLRLFEQGAFDISGSRPVDGGLELLTQYSQGKATLINSRFWGSARRSPPRAAVKRPKQSAAPAVEIPLPRPPAWGNVTVHRLT